VRRLSTSATFLALAFVAFAVADRLAHGQNVDDPELLGQLEQLFPAAASFTAKSGNPPHYKAYGAATSGQETVLLGLAWWTTELEPLERGYDGPIKMLVGMDTQGVLTSLIVTVSRTATSP
jgi:transcriptional regulator of nitric oxide reductase